MSGVFADAHFFFAVLNPNDAAHAKAREFARQHRGPLVTTAWVLTEVADGLAATPAGVSPPASRFGSQQGQPDRPRQPGDL